jgi:hypothetical protein
VINRVRAVSDHWVARGRAEHHEGGVRMGRKGAAGRLARAVAVVVALGAVATACVSSPPVRADVAPATVDPAPVVLQPAVLTAAQPVPAPTAAPVLTVIGRIGSTNSGNGLSFDPGTLDGLGRIRITVYEPWVKQTLDFQGVWLSDLIALARPDPGARTVHITALDDYQVDLTIDDVNAGGVLLATRSGDGSPIRVEDGGPTRIVFAGGKPSGASADQWIWSLSTIDIR